MVLYRFPRKTLTLRGNTKKQLEENREKLTLFDTALFTKNLESLYQEMWTSLKKV